MAKHLSAPAWMNGILDRCGWMKLLDDVPVEWLCVCIDCRVRRSERYDRGGEP